MNARRVAASIIDVLESEDRQSERRPFVCVSAERSSTWMFGTTERAISSERMRMKNHVLNEAKNGTESCCFPLATGSNCNLPDILFLFRNLHSDLFPSLSRRVQMQFNSVFHFFFHFPCFDFHNARSFEIRTYDSFSSARCLNCCRIFFPLSPLSLCPYSTPAPRLLHDSFLFCSSGSSLWVLCFMQLKWKECREKCTYECEKSAENYDSLVHSAVRTLEFRPYFILFSFICFFVPFRSVRICELCRALSRAG